VEYYSGQHIDTSENKKNISVMPSYKAGVKLTHSTALTKPDLISFTINMQTSIKHFYR
jgi:hypothetical protein